jgi:hypothetical protein
MSEKQETTAPTDRPDSRWQAVASRVVKDRTFVVAAGVLLVMALGRPIAVNALEIWLVKSPVPWPDAVQVSSETWQNVAFPETLGENERFVMVREDGLFADEDGIPDGDQPHPEDMLELLKIGGPSDQDRIDQRASNWYVSRVYNDTAREGMGPLWQLAIEYYTGGHDPVPHVPEVCLVAGGASETDSQEVSVHYPELPGPWGEPFNLRRVEYKYSDPATGASARFAQYYVFSLNGRPENDRLVVRGKLTNPFLKYAYFAKVQFSMRRSVTTLAAADQQAREFFAAALPAALEMLPDAETVEKLNSTDGEN